MSLPPCTHPDPRGPGSCKACAQWVGHCHVAPSALFANSSRSTAGPSPIPLPQIPFPHAHHESHASHDSSNFRGTHTFQNMPIYPQCQFHYFHPSTHVAPVAPQVILSSSKGRKRESSPVERDGGECKRQRVPPPVVAAPTSTSSGVGPTIPVTSHLSNNDSLLSSPQLPTITVQPPTDQKWDERPSRSSATDVWYFCRTSNSEIEPARPPLDQEPILKKKPHSPFVACKLCKEWRVYKNVGGITTTLRTHLKQHHGEEYEKVVSLLKLKHSDDLDHPTAPTTPPPEGQFELDEWIALMIRWIVMDDQSIDVVECKEFREFILYGLEDYVTERDLPDRMKLTELIFKAYGEERQKALDGFKSALGRVSFTCDCWIDPTLKSFLAVTAHFMAKDVNGQLVLRNHLLAFRVVKSKHDGKNLGRIIFEILKEAVLLEKIGEFTLDNALNCNTLMEDLEEVFRAAGIAFCRYGNRTIRCFPYVVDIAVQTVLKELKENGYDPVIATSTDPAGPSAKLIEYAAAVKSDLIGRSRRIVAVCFKSGQFRGDLKVINTGNSSKTWGPNVAIRLVQLLRDRETCWSSTFNMVDRLIELYPSVEQFLSQPSMSEHLFKQIEYEVLHHIHQVLEISHMCQKLLAAEKTPTLASALPIYEVLVVKWKGLAKVIPELSHYIGLGITKIMEYVSKGRQTRTYALAMIVNPGMKFKWIEEHWSPSERADAERWMEEAMLAHCRARRLAIARSRPAASRMGVPTAGNSAAIAQARLWAEFSNLSRVRHSTLLPSAARSLSSTPTPSTLTMPSLGSGTPTSTRSNLSSLPSVSSSTTEAEKAAQEAEDQARDLHAVRTDIRLYKEDPPPRGELDLVRYWNDYEEVHPLVFKVALDILPVQASAVSCERLFSSSKETCVSRRSLLPAGLPEVLHALKHFYDEKRLDFTSHWIANEDEHTI